MSSATALHLKYFPLCNVLSFISKVSVSLFTHICDVYYKDSFTQILMSKSQINHDHCQTLCDFKKSIFNFHFVGDGNTLSFRCSLSKETLGFMVFHFTYLIISFGKTIQGVELVHVTYG